MEATRLAKEMALDLKIDGELQADAALVEAVGSKKARVARSPVKRMFWYSRLWRWVISLISWFNAWVALRLSVRSFKVWLLR